MKFKRSSFHQEKLRNKNLELHDRDNKIRKLAINEFNVIHQYLSSSRELREKISQPEDNISHVTNLFFNKSLAAMQCVTLMKKEKTEKDTTEKQKQNKSKNYFSKKCQTVSCPK